jgi:hypothetical protein
MVIEFEYPLASVVYTEFFAWYILIAFDHIVVPKPVHLLRKEVFLFHDEAGSDHFDYLQN